VIIPPYSNFALEESMQKKAGEIVPEMPSPLTTTKVNVPPIPYLTSIPKPPSRCGIPQQLCMDENKSWCDGLLIEDVEVEDHLMREDGTPLSEREKKIRKKNNSQIIPNPIQLNATSITSSQPNPIPIPIPIPSSSQIEDPIQIPLPVFIVDPKLLPSGMNGISVLASPYTIPLPLSQNSLAPTLAPIPNFAELTTTITDSHPLISNILNEGQKDNSQSQIRIANSFSLNTSTLPSTPSSHTYM
jgi:hypothetical protein